jgi:hypothetical protein
MSLLFLYIDRYEFWSSLKKVENGLFVLVFNLA